VIRRALTILVVLAVSLGIGAVAATPAFAAFEGTYRIKPPGYDMCLDVTGVSYANGALLQMYQCLPNQNNQRFNIYTGVGNRVEIRAVHSGKCLDVLGVSYSPGTVIQQYDCLGPTQTNQQFFRNWFYGNAQLMAEHSGFCISAPGWGGYYNGDPVTQDWCSGGGGRDMWRLVPA